VSRNITPRPIKASGARDAHGKILERGAGSLYVHMHREAGLAHRHYVLNSWQVRALAILTSRPALVLYVAAIATWGKMAAQAARVPVLKLEVAALTADAQRLDTLTATLAQLQTRYEQVQQMLSVATGAAPRETSARPASTVPDPTKNAAPAALPPRARSTTIDSAKDSTVTTRRDTTSDTTDAPAIVRDSTLPDTGR